MIHPKVTIIILNWNGKEDTIECLESLKHITYPNYELLLVDNGSTDGSVECFRGRYSEMEIIENGDNLGFAEGSNVGIRRAMEKDTDYVLLLNNDTVVDPEFLGELVKVAEGDEWIGIVGPKILYYDRPSIINQLGGYINYIIGGPIGYKSGQTDIGQYDKNIEVKFLSGTALLIHKKVFVNIGLLDPIYFVTHEETDFEMRAQAAGYKLLCAPKSKLYHKISASMNKVPGISRYYAIRNRFIFMGRYASNIQIFVFFVWFCFITLPQLIISLFVKNKKSKKQYLKYIFDGTFDGLTILAKEKRDGFYFFLVRHKL